MVGSAVFGIEEEQDLSLLDPKVEPFFPSQCDRKPRVAACWVSSVARRSFWASTRA
jgi:hypothetical protein